MQTKILLLLLSLFLLSAEVSTSQKFNVATYNMRYENKDDSINGNGWQQRLHVIASLIRFHDFDIFGTQECLYNQLQDLSKNLPGYAYIGIGRDDGIHGGEHSAIFYKTERFQLINKGDFWLSAITDKPNKGWDAALPRICSWGKFHDRQANKYFFLFNLHMDHIGINARKESSKLVLEMIKKLADGEEVILTGDFNIDQTNESYQLVNTSGVLKDTYDLSPIVYANNGTFNNFSTNEKSESRIDHIFITKNFKVNRYGILTDTYRLKTAGKDSAVTTSYSARTPSDHFPVMVELTY